MSQVKPCIPHLMLLISLCVPEQLKKTAKTKHKNDCAISGSTSTINKGDKDGDLLNP